MEGIPENQLNSTQLDSTRLCNIYNVFTHPGHVLLWTSTFCPISHFIIKTVVFVNVNVDVDVDVDADADVDDDDVVNVNVNVDVDVDADADADDDVDDDDGCYRCRIFIFFPFFPMRKLMRKNLNL